MTPISLRYKKSTTGKEQPPTDCFHVKYVRPDGRLATDVEIEKIHSSFIRAMARAGEKAEETGQFVEPEWAHGGYQVEVVRDDGLPMSIYDVQSFMLMDTMRRKAAFQEVEVVTVAKGTYSLLSALPVLGAQAWTSAIQQLVPERDEQEEGAETDDSFEQVVTLENAKGARLLMDLGLITSHNGNKPNQYVVPRDVAYCRVEWRQDGSM